MLQTYRTHLTALGIAVSLFFLKAQSVMAQMKTWNDLDGSGPKLPDQEGNTCLVNDVPTLKCLEVVTGNLLFMVNALVLLVLFIMLVIGSYKYLLSLGQPDKIEDAKKTFTWAIIGVVVYASSYLILLVIDNLFLGGQGQIFQLDIGGP